jgi:hypothetical protein
VECKALLSAQQQYAAALQQQQQEVGALQQRLKDAVERAAKVRQHADK